MRFFLVEDNEDNVRILVGHIRSNAISTVYYLSDRGVLDLVDQRFKNNTLEESCLFVANDVESALKFLGKEIPLDFALLDVSLNNAGSVNMDGITIIAKKIHKKITDEAISAFPRAIFTSYGFGENNDDEFSINDIEREAKKFGIHKTSIHIRKRLQESPNLLWDFVYNQMNTFERPSNNSKDNIKLGFRWVVMDGDKEITDGHISLFHRDEVCYLRGSQRLIPPYSRDRTEVFTTSATGRIPNNLSTNRRKITAIYKDFVQCGPSYLINIRTVKTIQQNGRIIFQKNVPPITDINTTGLRILKKNLTIL